MAAAASLISTPNTLSKNLNQKINTVSDTDYRAFGCNRLYLTYSHLLQSSVQKRLSWLEVSTFRVLQLLQWWWSGI